MIRIINTIKNWLICKRYPFLLIKSNTTTDKYYSTMMDGMPEGWKKAFGWKLVREIRHYLKSTNQLYDYEVYQIKEKFGCLHWYDNIHDEELEHIINKYVELSIRTCIKCGRKAEYITKGWVQPVCEDCKNKMLQTFSNQQFTNINDIYN